MSSTYTFNSVSFNHGTRNCSVAKKTNVLLLPFEQCSFSDETEAICCFVAKITLFKRQ